MDSEHVSQIEESPLEITFGRASKHFASMVSSMSHDELLHFYGRYKQATEGDCSGDRPSLFNMTARSKYDAWKRLSGVTKMAAMEEYIKGVKERDPQWTGEDADAGWVRVSRMPAPPPRDNNQEADDDASVFLDAVRDGRLSFLQAMPRLDQLVTLHFTDGMTGLHWACDSGQEEVAELLLLRGALVDAEDEAGQTGLHYAASCGHGRLLQLLLRHNADVTVTDHDGLTPKEAADDQHIKLLL